MDGRWIYQTCHSQSNLYNYVRMCLSLETQHVLEHALFPDATSSVEKVLDFLHEHIKG